MVIRKTIQIHKCCLNAKADPAIMAVVCIDLRSDPEDIL